VDEPRELARLEASLTATRAVGGVVSAVWALARAQLPRAERAVAEGFAYLEWLDRFVEEVAGSPLDAPPSRTLTVLLGPERPFCGDLAREVLEAAPPEGGVGLVGERLAETARRELDRPPRFVVAGPAGVDDLAAVSARLAGAILEEVAADPRPERDLRVELVHLAERRGRPERVLLLPSRRERPRGGRDLFSPAERVAEAAVRESVIGHLHVGLARTLLAETRARAAMADRARRAVEEREEELVTALRVLEREQITTELIELAAGIRAGR
jgi:F0F1-type ATP synthase gamma subunit